MLTLLFPKVIFKAGMLVVSYDFRVNFWMWGISVLATFHVGRWCLEESGRKGVLGQEIGDGKWHHF